MSSQVRKTYWEWMAVLPRAFPTSTLGTPLVMILNSTQTSQKALYGEGKGRLALRTLLTKRLLTHTLRIIRLRKDILSDYYEPRGIVADEVMGEMLISLLAPLEELCKFSLNLRNASFLDESWELGWFRRFELVPCKRLGLDLLAVNGRILVCEVESGSVADEDLKIEPGDILDDIFGESLRQSTVTRVARLLDDFAGSPVYISVQKALNTSSDFYRPILHYIETAGLNKAAIMANRARRLKEMREQGTVWDTADVCTSSDTGDAREDREEERCEEGRVEEPMMESEWRAEEAGERVYLWGSVDVGRVGTVEQIETGVLNVIRRGEMAKRPVIVSLRETHVTVYCGKSNAVLLRHGYPEISSCGRRIDYPLNFSFIAGETTCTLAKRFTCFVFEARSDEQSKAILKAIADGFDRTHWAV